MRTANPPRNPSGARSPAGAADRPPRFPESAFGSIQATRSCPVPDEHPRSPDAPQRNPGAATGHSPPRLDPGLGPVQRPSLPTPRKVIDRRASGLLVIEWLDGSYSALPHAWLRARCRCASCTQAARSGATLAVGSVMLTGIRPISDQALNLVFSDGHGRGIYPWTYLRALGDEYAASPTHCHA